MPDWRISLIAAISIVASHASAFAADSSDAAIKVQEGNVNNWIKYYESQKQSGSKTGQADKSSVATRPEDQASPALSPENKAPARKPE
ncbi:MAG: hypothetical protein ACKVP2_02070 [Burkholderiales bacterium]